MEDSNKYTPFDGVEEKEKGGLFDKNADRSSAIIETVCLDEE